MFFYLLCVCFVVVHSGNPFEGKTFYVNPSFQAELATSIATADGQTKANLQEMSNVGSAYWIDTMSKIRGSGTKTVEGILADAASKSPAPLVLFIVYDLPNRDCHAKASNGEICCTSKPDGTCDYEAGGDCAEGLSKYKTSYIDPLVEVFAKYHTRVPIVAVVEPDSLPNLATNMADNHCGNSATVAAYRTGIPYAVSQIALKAPQVAQYLDAAHGGWLGWSDNMVKFSQTVKELGILNFIRGFATNTANYQPLGTLCPTWDWCRPNYNHGNDPCCADPCRLTTQWNPSNNELNYVQQLAANFGPNFHYIIDTGRNGVVNMRQDCANWCNIRGAGVGLMPTTRTANSTIIDAYFWLKTPGESDGCTAELPSGSMCPRFDSMCASSDSLGSRQGEPRAPQAGQWFDYQIKQLAANAHFNP